MNINLLICYLVVFCASQEIFCDDALVERSDTMVEVKVKQGWLSGELVETVTGDSKYYSFKGIPYAQPPVGNLRFKAPQPPLPWEGVRNATKHGSKCPQMDIFTNTIIPGSEDCLFLNVYSPDIKPESPLPVMVFIHGGGYKSGSGDDDEYGPDFLVPYDVILVTFNYRLEALGFLCLDTEDVPGNAALKDQVAALRWVQDNISSFGGDPKNVTIFGESAGGSAAVYHIISPMSKGLFKRAISMSGAPFCDWSLSFVPQLRAFLLGKDLGFETNDPKELLGFLQSVPVEKLLNTNPVVLSMENSNLNHIDKMYHFGPVIEKDFGKSNFLTEEPLEALKNKRISDVDLLMGHTSKETVYGVAMFEALLETYNRYPEMLVPRKMLIKCTPEVVLEISKRIHEYYFNGKPIKVEHMKEFITFADHAYFVSDIIRFIQHYPKVGNGQKYMYQFSCFSSRNVHGIEGLKYGIQGASHLDDLLYAFNPNKRNLKVDKTSREYELIKLVTTVFTNFAKYGNPTPDSSLGITWPEYNNSTKAYVDIGDTLTSKADNIPEALEFWKSLFDYAGMEF